MKKVSISKHFPALSQFSKKREFITEIKPVDSWKESLWSMWDGGSRSQFKAVCPMDKPGEARFMTVSAVTSPMQSMKPEQTEFFGEASKLEYGHFQGKETRPRLTCTLLGAMRLCGFKGGHLPNDFAPHAAPFMVADWMAENVGMPESVLFRELFVEA